MLRLTYQTYGWLFYISQTLFTLANWTVANIFLLTAITLSLTLEVAKLKNESAKLLIERSTRKSGYDSWDKETGANMLSPM